MMKICTKCTDKQPVENFGLRAAAKDGRNPWCRECSRRETRASYNKNKHKYREKQAEYSRKNSAKKTALAKAWCLANPGRSKATHRRIYLRTKAKRLRKQKERYATDAVFRETYLKRVADWRRRNPEKCKEYENKRRALLLHAFDEAVERKIVYVRDDKACYICKRSLRLKEMELDHVVPLSRGGRHSYANVKACCSQCNRKKSNKMPEGCS